MDRAFPRWMWLGLDKYNIVHLKLFKSFAYIYIYTYKAFLYYYKLAKRTKFLLAVIYRSPWRHWNCSKTLKNKSEKSKFILTGILRPVKSFKRWTGPTVTLFDGLFLGKYWRQDVPSLQFVLLNLALISLIVWKLWALQHCNHCGNF